jgi:hypothetical protein
MPRSTVLDDLERARAAAGPVVAPARDVARRPRTSGFRLFLVSWAVVCGGAWLVVGIIGETETAECRGGYGYVCLPAGVALGVSAVGALAVWLGGAGVAWVVKELIWPSSAGGRA